MLDQTVLPIRGEDASLRVMGRDDAAAYAAGSADALVREFGHLPEPEYTEDSVTQLIEGSIREGLERGDLAVLAIGDPATDEFAGSLVLFGVADGSAEVGFWVHPEFRGKGVARAAIGLALEFAKQSGLAQLTARTVPENLASRKALEASGFVRGEDVDDVAPSGDIVRLTGYIYEL